MYIIVQYTSWCRYVGACLNEPFLGVWQSLNFDKECIFGFETLFYASSGIVSMHNQLVTLQRGRKLEIASYDPFKNLKFTGLFPNLFLYI